MAVSSSDTSSPAKCFTVAPPRCSWPMPTDHVPPSRVEQPPPRSGAPITPSVLSCHLQLVVLAVARVAGELGAGIAQAGGMDLGTILADVTEAVRKAGRTHHELLRAEELP